MQRRDLLVSSAAGVVGFGSGSLALGADAAPAPAPRGPSLARQTRKILIAGGGFGTASIRYMAELTGKERPRLCCRLSGCADRKRLSFPMDTKIREYLQEIGRKGGKASRRTLDPDTARRMVAVREARRAYRRFHASCFWSSPPDLDIAMEDVEWVAGQLMKHGDREAWLAGKALCP